MDCGGGRSLIFRDEEVTIRNVGREDRKDDAMCRTSERCLNVPQERSELGMEMSNDEMSNDEMSFVSKSRAR